MRIRIQDPGSGIFLTLDPGSGMGKFGSDIPDTQRNTGYGWSRLLLESDQWSY